MSSSGRHGSDVRICALPSGEECWEQPFLKVSFSQQEQLQALEQDSGSLAALVYKVRSLGHWRLAVQQARFQRRVDRAEKVSAREGRPRPAGRGQVGGARLPWRRGCGAAQGSWWRVARSTLLKDLTVGEFSWEVATCQSLQRNRKEPEANGKEANGKTDEKI